MVAKAEIHKVEELIRVESSILTVKVVDACETQETGFGIARSMERADALRVQLGLPLRWTRLATKLWEMQYDTE